MTLRLILLQALLALAACGGEMAALSGSASMQVEIEVYKGPLAKERLIQKAELEGGIVDVAAMTETLSDRALITMCRRACFDWTNPKRTPSSYGFGPTTDDTETISRVC